MRPAAAQSFFASRTTILTLPILIQLAALPERAYYPEAIRRQRFCSLFTLL